MNGSRVRATLLEDGDELVVGPFSIQFRYDAHSRSLGPQDDQISCASFENAAVSTMGSSLQSEEMTDADVEELGNATRPVLQPFSEATGPMPDQLRQIMMMANVFEAMQGDQLEASREDHAEIRRLAEEIHALRQELHAYESCLHSVPADLAFSTDHVQSEWSSFRADVSRRMDGSRIHPDDPPKGARPTRPASPRQGPTSGSASQKAEDRSMLRRDPRELHAIASQFLSTYNMERLSLREKIIRILLGPSDANPMMR